MGDDGRVGELENLYDVILCLYEMEKMSIQLMSRVGDGGLGVDEKECGLIFCSSLFLSGKPSKAET